MRRLLALGMSLALALAVGAPTVAARDIEPVGGMDVLQAVTDPGRCWTSDDIGHCRGWTGLYETTGDPLVAGTSVVVANWNLDAMGNGTLWGTIDLTLADGNGGWHHSWVAKSEGGLWAGPTVGHGWGTLEGMQFRADAWSLAMGVDQFEGFVFQPGG